MSTISLTQFPVIYPKVVAHNIKLLMIDRNVSVKELQDYMGFDNPQSIYRWLRGDAIPSIDHLYALSVGFGISINEILGKKADDDIFPRLH